MNCNTRKCDFNIKLTYYTRNVAMTWPTTEEETYYIIAMAIALVYYVDIAKHKKWGAAAPRP